MTTRAIWLGIAAAAIGLASMTGCGGGGAVSEAKCRVFWTQEFADQAPSAGRTAAIEYQIQQCVADHSGDNPARHPVTTG